MLGLKEDIVTLVRRSRLGWYGHVLHRNEGEGIRRVLEVEGERGVENAQSWAGRNKRRGTE